ncbi:NTP transferase domain-containing protein [candidate division WOR-3 bacterium]|nr:NTP transferase domain-containing protein [candidate division WOR-3 bacterium]
MRTAVTITVRMKSTRLPEKAMKDLVGKPMIEHLIDRLRYAKLPDEIILCTSTNPQDDILVEVAKKNHIKWFRGDEMDVLKRLLDAAKKYKIDFIVSTTGDNPLTDPHYIDRLIKKFEETDADYITCLDLPLGAFSYGVKVQALEKVVELKKERDTEIWGVYFTKSNLFKIEKVEVESQVRHPEIRLTADTPEDFRVMGEIYGRLYREGELIELVEVINLLKENPLLMEINKNITQRKASKIDTSRMRI